MRGTPGLGMDDHRERVFGQLKVLVDSGAVHRAFPKHLGGEDNHGGSIASFEELVVADPSLQIKAGVQWGLFGCAVLHLGTQEHQDKWLPGIMSLEIPGAFAMTEIGHGSDVASIGTTATYDADAQEFVINTPFKAAWKEFLGNAGVHGKAAVVFAQLITRGVNHGVHAFYVDIRDENGFLPGVGGQDDGLKGGLNGIDNGRLHFTNVRIPRTNLLNRYGNVTEDGTYSSPIHSPGRRFFTMLGTLVQGRVSLDGAATAASKVALQIAVTYANQRRQFNASSDTVEETLMDYQRHQRRLIPRLARTYAASFAHEELLAKFDGVFSGATDTDEDRQDLETFAAALKSLSTWDALDTLQECREACGGSGFIAENRFTQLRADLDIYVTFEGDNNVLLQLVGKRLLTDYGQEFRDLNAGVLARYVVKHARKRGAEPLGAAFGGPGRRRHRLGAQERELLQGRGQPACPAHRPGQCHGRGNRRCAARGLHQGPGQERRGLQLPPGPAHRRSPGPRRAAALGGLHPSPRRNHRHRYPDGAHLVARCLCLDPHRGQPRLVPDERAPVHAAGPHPLGLREHPAGPPAPARPGPCRCLRLRPGAPACSHRQRRGKRAPGRGHGVLPPPARQRRCPGG